MLLVYSLSAFTLTDLTRLQSKQQLRCMGADKESAGLSESSCRPTILCVSCPFEIIFYSVLKHTNTTPVLECTQSADFYSTHLRYSWITNIT